MVDEIFNQAPAGEAGDEMPSGIDGEALPEATEEKLPFEEEGGEASGEQ